MNRERAFDLAGTGSMVVDTIYRAPRLLGRDEKGLLRAHPGGAIAQRLVGGVMVNQLGWAALFGLRTACFGKQADDPEGRFLRAGMASLGIATEIDLSGGHSSFAQVYVDPAGERAIYMARGATAELTPGEIDARHARTIEAASVVSTEVSQLPLASALRVLERARAAGASTALDLDVPLEQARETLGSESDFHALLERADILKPSLGAAESLARAANPEALATALAERYGARVVALTLGARGALLYAAGRAVHCPALPIDVVDSTGAGDAFFGALLAGLHLALAPADALRLGCAAGAACCERLGGFPDASARARVLDHYGALGGAPFAPPPMRVGPEPSEGSFALAEFLSLAPDELLRAARALDPARVRAAAALVEDVERSGGRVHVTGVGKPEHVARYGAALLSSTGTPATFLHATEAVHGSLGQLRPGDLLIAISNSGTTSELLACVEAARRFGARVVAVTARTDSPLARASEVVLPARVEREGGTLGLAPRTSVLAEVLALAALSVELEARNKLLLADYAARHPAGALGQQATRRPS